MYSKIFGYAITEGKTFSEKCPGSRYWDDVTEMERSCLCERKIMNLHPSLSTDRLLINTPIVRNTGNKIRHRWKWTLQSLPDQFHSPSPIPKEFSYPLLSILKEKTLSLLADYAAVQSNCSFRRNLVNCEVRSYACVYSKGTPPDTPIHYDKAKELSGNIISIKSLAQRLQIIDGCRYVNLRVHPQILRRKNYNVAT